MDRLRVLITNIRLSSGSGTEKYVFDLATHLLRLGHLPVVYASELGQLADQLQAAGVPVTAALDTITVRPDVIHGHHSLETMAAMLHFSDVPGIFVCHDFDAWHDCSPRFPRIYRYVAVDYACRERLICQHAIPPERVDILFNAVDLARFSRRSPLPAAPRRAVVLSNNMTLRDVRPVQQACSRRNITLDLCGSKLGGRRDPAALFADYDLVFAKARCAWEALASGTAVVVCDVAGIGTLVTSNNLDELRRWNFGRRLLRRPLCSETVGAQIDCYDADDSARVTDTIRGSAGINGLVEQLVGLYEDVIAEHAAQPLDPIAESAAAASFLEWWASTRHQLIRQQARRDRLPAVFARLSHTVGRRIVLRMKKLAMSDRRLPKRTGSAELTVATPRF